MRFIVSAVAIAFALLLPAQSGAQSWDEYRPGGVGVRIEMPGKPKLETKKTSSGQNAYHAIATVGDTAFLVIYGDKDDRKGPSVDTLLDAVVKGQSDGKKVLRSKKDMIGGLPARRIAFEDDDKDQFESRVVIVDNRLVQAIFVGPLGNALGRRFLDSLAIVDP